MKQLENTKSTTRFNEHSILKLITHKTVILAFLIFSAVPAFADWGATYISSPVGNLGNIEVLDLDGDGDLDVLATNSASAPGKIYWLMNDGKENFSEDETKTISLDGIKINSNPSSILHDLDHDGDQDIYLPTDKGVFWFENLGAGFSESIQVTSGTTQNANSNDSYAADMDGDGDIDIISAHLGQDLIAWHENDCKQTDCWDGSVRPGFTYQKVVKGHTNGPNGPWSIYAEDINGDGNMDVLSTSQHDDELAWYRNDGAEDPSFTYNHISGPASFHNNPKIPRAADMNGDGDMDVLVFATHGTKKLIWYDNDGNENFTPYVIDNPVGPLTILTKDVDGDGDMDVVSGNSAGTIIYENDGNTTPSFTAVSLGQKSLTLKFVDMDRDGTTDIFSSRGDSETSNQFVLYNNGRRINVATDGSDESGDGSSGNPYKTIQYAIDHYQTYSADTILVGPGTYTENINFNGKDVIVGSLTLTTRDKSYVSQTIIDGSSPSNAESASVVTFVNGETPSAQLVGFTLQNGTGTNITIGDEIKRVGGGIYTYETSPSLKHLDIKNNNQSIVHGGGIYFDYNSDASLDSSLVRDNQVTSHGGGIYVGTHANVKLDSVLIRDNSAVRGGGYSNPKRGWTMFTNVRVVSNTADELGGGMYIGGENWSDPEFYHITVSENTAGQDGGGIYLWHSKNRIKMYDLTLSDNTAVNKGGGLFTRSSDPTIDRAIISGNSAKYGGGIYVWDHLVVLKLINTLLYDNLATALGSAISAYDRPQVKIYHSTFSQNFASDQSTIYADAGSKIYFYNSIIWDSETPKKVVFGGTGNKIGRFEARSSIVQGLESIEASDNNDVIDYDGTSFETDPYFSNPGSNDFNLKNYSPAIGYASTSNSLSPNADESALNIDLTKAPRSTGPDIGAYENSLDSPANAPPLMNAISDLTISEDSGEQLVIFAGVSDGDFHLEQSMTVTSKSADATLIPHPTPNYISPNTTGSITFTSATNANGTIALIVKVTDDAGIENDGIDTLLTSFNVTITPVNDPPSVTSSSISTAENVTSVGNVEASDPEDDPITYTLEEGDDSGKFTLTSEGALSFKDAPNYESPGDSDGDNQYILSITTSDGTLSETSDVTITVTDADDGPEVANEIAEVIVNEDAPDSTIDISNVFSDEDDDAITTTVSANSNTSLITATADGNSLTLDFLSDKYGSATITLQGESNGKTTTESFGINVTSVNDPPYITTADTVSAAENQISVTTLTASDPDPETTDFSYSLLGGDDESKFSLTTDGVLTFNEAKNKESPDDNNGDGTYLVEVQVEDDASSTGSKTVAVTLTSVNEAPSNITLSSRVVNDNSTSGTPVGRLNVSDVDVGDSHSFSFVTGDGSTDNGNFTLSVDSLKAATTMDAETKKTHAIRIKVADSGSLSYEKTFTVIVKGLNDNIPVVTGDQSFSVSEASAVDSDVGTVLATDADTEDVMQDWRIESGNDENYFTIGASTGTIAISKILNYEIKTSYKLGVTVTDGVYTSSIGTVTINVEDVSEGVTVTRTSGLETTESAGQDTFSIVLDSAPLHDVIIPLQSSDLTEGTVSPDTLTFTSSNWKTRQKVTVTGVDDTDDVVNVDYTIRVKPTLSDDPNYHGLNPEDVSVTNLDDEKGGFTIQPGGGLITSENGGSDLFKVSLQIEPTHSVTIPVSLEDTTEGLIEVSELVFTTANWSTPQGIVVVGLDDEISDGNVDYSIELGTTISEDAAYNGKDPTDVSATNIDNDIKKILLYPLEGIFVSEDGGKAFFNVRLQAAPSGDVKIPFTSADTLKATISPDTLIFTADSWDGIKKVYVTAIADSNSYIDEMLEIISEPAISIDPAYSNYDVPNPTVYILNEDPPGISVTPLTGLNVSESGDTSVLSMKLLSEPKNDVTIELSSSDETESILDQSSVTFTSVNYNTTQFITVLGVNDNIDDGDQKFIVITEAVSDDPLYNGLEVSDPVLRNIDDEGAGFVINPLSGLSTSEDGTNAQTHIQLRTSPSSPVTLLLASANDEEGTVLPASLSFNSSNWSESQTVTITGVDDVVKDDSIQFAIVTFPAESEDSSYKQIDPVDIIVFNKDNDDVGFKVIADPDRTTEIGGAVGITVNLTAKPTEDVIFIASSSDTTEGKIPEGENIIIATPEMWRENFDFKVKGIDDNEADYDVEYYVTIGIVSDDKIFSDLPDKVVQLVNEDFEPKIEISKEPTWDGSVAIGDTKTDTLEVYNEGNDTLKVTGIETDRQEFYTDMEQFDTAPEDTTILEIHFSPSEKGFFDGELKFSHNDPTRQDTIKISLNASGRLPDTNKPTIKIISYADNINIGESLDVKATITDSSVLAKQRLYYWTINKGEMEEKYIDMDIDDDSTFTAVIPGGSITNKGIYFYIFAEDIRGNTRKTPVHSATVQFDLAQISSMIDGSPFEGGIPKNQWSLISIPWVHDKYSAKDLLNDSQSITKQDRINWNWIIYKWKPPAKYPDGLEEADSLESGKAYWLKQTVDSNLELFMTGHGSSYDSASFTFTLKPESWNMIGNPYPFKVKIEADETKFYGPITWKKNQWTSQIQPEEELLPWGGYVIYNKTKKDQELILKPFELSTSFSGNYFTEADGWKLNIGAYGKTYVDPGNAVGRLSGSLEGLDYRDNPEPPYMGGYISVVMPRSEWNENISHFTSDIRSLAEPDGVWDVELRVNKETSPVTLSMDMEGDFPVEHDIVLLDLINRKTHHIKDTSSVTLNQNWDKLPVYPFKVIAGTPEYVSSMTQEILSQLPEKFSLHQNYPNPFNPATTIGFEVPIPSQVSLKIYNLMGQEIRTLTNEWLPTGSHRLIWNGKDQRGIPVSAGVYIYRLQSQDFQKTRKMVLLK